MQEQLSWLDASCVGGMAAEFSREAFTLTCIPEASGRRSVP
jgi:hypothetical protein